MRKLHLVLVLVVVIRRDAYYAVGLLFIIAREILIVDAIRGYIIFFIFEGNRFAAVGQLANHIANLRRRWIIGIAIGVQHTVLAGNIIYRFVLIVNGRLVINPVELILLL